MADLIIGTDTFTVNPLAGEASFLLQPRVLPLVAELLSLMGLGDKGKAAPPTPDTAPAEEGEEPPAPTRDLGQLLANAGPIVARACERMPPAELKFIMRELLRGATMNGQPLYSTNGNAIDVLMRGRVIDMWRLLLHALQVSYPDFFGLLRGLRKKPAESVPSETSATSGPGPSGG